MQLLRTLPADSSLTSSRGSGSAQLCLLLAVWCWPSPFVSRGRLFISKMQGLTRWFPNFLVALAFHASVTGPSCISAGRTFMKPHIPLMTSTVSSRLLLCVVESALTHLIHIILSRRILDFLQCSSACISKATFPALLKARGTSCLSFGQWDGSGSGFQGSPFHSLFFLPAARKTALMTGAPAATRGQRQLWGLNGGTEKRGRVWA